jgi:deazaflavin-dependent oxidoreductase (nitroreductase family)
MSESVERELKSLKKEHFAFLTTIGRRSGKAHTVQVWFAFADGKIYMSHEGEYTDWMRNITKNGRVRVRIGSSNYEGEARTVKQGTSREVGKNSLYEKYYGPAAKATIDDWFELSTIVELSQLKKT